jgi:hypothetical protein
MSTRDTTAFNARSQAQFFAADRLFRVYLAPGGMFFIRIGGSRHDQVAIHFGLIGWIISNMTMKQREREAEERASELDQASLRDRLEDHKDNFREPYAEIISSVIQTSTSFLTGMSGQHFGRWTLDFENRKALKLQFDTLDDMRIAVRELPKVLGDVHINRVEWDDRKQKYVKSRTPRVSER